MIARIILVAFGVAMVGTGVAFCGVAIYLLLCSVASAPAAAAFTALILFFTAGAGATIYLAVSGSHAITLPPMVKNPPTDGTLVAALALMAKEHPLMAVGCAAALGMTDAMNRKVK